MKYVIISDIHSNLEAFIAVIKDATSLVFQQPGKNKVVVIGDILGHGPNPNEVANLVFSQFSENVVAGNHEQYISAALSRLAIDRRDPFVGFAEKWTIDSLNNVNKQRINGLVGSERYMIEDRGAIFAHSNPLFPKHMCYIETLSDASKLFLYKGFEKKIAFVGHTHIPKLYTRIGLSINEVCANPIDCGISSQDLEFSLDGVDQALMVVPSVSRSRDGCNKAGYTIYDDLTQRISLRRVGYDFKKTQKKMQLANLPQRWIDRLECAQ